MYIVPQIVHCSSAAVGLTKRSTATVSGQPESTVKAWVNDNVRNLRLSNAPGQGVIFLGDGLQAGVPVAINNFRELLLKTNFIDGKFEKPVIFAIDTEVSYSGISKLMLAEELEGKDTHILKDIPSHMNSNTKPGSLILSNTLVAENLGVYSTVSIYNRGSGSLDLTVAGVYTYLKAAAGVTPITHNHNCIDLGVCIESNKSDFEYFAELFYNTKGGMLNIFPFKDSYEIVDEILPAGTTNYNPDFKLPVRPSDQIFLPTSRAVSLSNYGTTNRVTVDSYGKLVVQRESYKVPVIKTAGLKRLLNTR